jgi:hypothetical protein
MNTRLRRIMMIFLLCTTGFAGYAQHLPNVQKGGLRAPDKVKIDGKLNEWGDNLQAHNNATEVSYTIANDDNNLYLVVQATKFDIINKAIRGGITLTINHTKSKTDEHPIILTFPVMDNSKDGFAITQSFNRKPGETKDTAIIRKQTDSLRLATNKLLSEKLKKVKVLGIKAVIDTFISVYNDEGIEVAVLADHKRACNFEIAIPIKYLELPINGSQPFAYNVRLNASPTGNMVMARMPNGVVTMAISVGPAGYSSSGGYDTDFWGEYTIKK